MSESDDHRGGTLVEGLIRRLRETVTVERVFGEPVERDGVTVIPAAAVKFGGGGGGGEGGDDHGSGSGEGGGFGGVARPVGAYVIDASGVQWRPAVDVTRLFVAANLTAVAYLFFRWRIARVRAKHG